MSSADSRTVLITGAAGMLGSQLARTAPSGVSVLGTDLAPGADVHVAGVDLCDAGAVARLFEAHPALAGVLHAAAYTAVDKAEEEVALAERVNAQACLVLAERCARQGVPLVAVSTDFVFDGALRRPYTEEDAPNPLSVYGRTKLAGERHVLERCPAGGAVVRTQWLYGPRGKHFPRTIVALARARGALSVVDDQVGAPTSTLALAPALWDVLRLGGRGVFHAACEGSCSWFGFTERILAGVGLAGVRLDPVSTEAFPRPARRPPYSVLDSSRLARLRGRTLGSWQDALSDYLAVEAL